MNEFDRNTLALENAVTRAFKEGSRAGADRFADRLSSWAFWGVMFYMAIVVTIHLASPRDSTDGDNRSGMRLHTDNHTGCQYLSVPGGGITPRMDINGDHYGCGSGSR